MILRRPILLLLPAFAMCQPAPASAGSSSLARLLSDSPFGMATRQTTASANAPAALLEFRAVMVEGDAIYFSVFEAATKASLWVRLNEPGNAFEVKTYDSQQECVTVEYDGRSLILPLTRAKAVVGAASVGSPQYAATEAPGAASSGANYISYRPPPDPAILALVEAVRRRRAAHAAAAQSSAPTPAAPN